MTCTPAGVATTGSNISGDYRIDDPDKFDSAALANFQPNPANPTGPWATLHFDAQIGGIYKDT